MGDDATAVSSTAEVEHAEDEAPPEVRYGFSVRPRVERIDGKTAPLVALPGGGVFVTGTWSSSNREERLREDNLLGHEWTAGAGLSVDLGFARLDGHATYGHVENDLGVGDYTDLGASLTRWFRIDDGVAGFFSLSVGQRRWRGDPVPGELDATTILLSFGIRW